MRLPFLWLSAAFAGGILLSWEGVLPPSAWLAATAVCLAAGAILFLRARLAAAWAAGLACWLCVGGLAASLEPLSLPWNHVTRLIASGALPGDIALRWRGRLRNDPLRLPWGVRYEVDLEEVEISGQPHTVSGGLRISYFQNEPASGSISLLRAGDPVEALVRARPPRNFLNPGAFDARAQMEREGIHLTASLRSLELLRKTGEAPPQLAHRLARFRGAMLERVEAVFADRPAHAAVLRAMLLGDRSFVDNNLAEQFQRTAAYHVLVVSGLHVAALAVVLFWIGTRLRMPRWLIALVILLVLAAFVAVVEDRPPILRAALMSAVTLLATLLFRRVELLNTIAVAAALLLLARPSALADPSFQLSFLAAGMIGALALPWVARTSAPYRHALTQLSDPGRDPMDAPRVAQFRLDLRAAIAWLEARLPFAPARSAWAARTTLVWPCAVILRVWEVFLVSAAIQLGMLPLMALYFHRVSASGVLANVPAALLSAAIVPAGFLALLLSSIPAVGSLLATITAWLVSLLLASVEWLSRGAWTWRVPDPPAWLVAAYLGTIVAVAIVAQVAKNADASSPTARRRWPWLVVALHVAAGLLLVTHPFPPRLARGQLEITTLDVGQGDAIFTAFPDGRTLLVDAGGQFGGSRDRGVRSGLDIGEQVVSPYLWSRGIQRLDVVALTHAHQDHLDGLHAVLDNFKVGELWVTREVDTPAYRDLLQTAARRGVRVVYRWRGSFFTWDKVSGLVLWPDAAMTPVADAGNNDSLVLRFDYGRTSALLAGDIERDAEAELVARRDPLDVDVLKVPHHGSRTSTTQPFLSVVTPQFAAISLSPTNPFGHPHAEVLRRLQGVGARTLRTDTDGAITFLSDGQSWRVSSYAGTKH